VNLHLSGRNASEAGAFDVAAFGRKVMMLTADTIRGLEGVADKFHVDPGAIRSGEQAFGESRVRDH
jgi:hypothetical protein